MARARRRPNTSLKSDLFERAQAYDLFQALRIVEQIAAEENLAAGKPPPDPTGCGVDPSNTAMRIRSAVPLGYAATEVVSVRRPRNSSHIEVTQTVVGLTGTSGVLPHAFSELVHVSVRERNPGLRDFLDIFNNRLAGLLFEAWSKHRLAVEHDRAARINTSMPIDTALKSVVGIGLAALSRRIAAADETLVHFGGFLARSGRSAHAVEQILCGATGHPVQVLQFQGRWLPVAQTDRSRLPDADSSRGSFCQLGEDFVVGERIFDVQATVSLHIGPLNYPAFRALLPDGGRARGFVDLAATALGPDMAFDMVLELAAHEVPSLHLMGEDNHTTANRLGWNTWLATDTRREAAATVVVQPPPHLR